MELRILTGVLVWGYAERRVFRNWILIRFFLKAIDWGFPKRFVLQVSKRNFDKFSILPSYKLLYILHEFRRPLLPTWCKWDFSLFWDITRRRFVVSYRRFGTTNWSHFQGSSSPKKILRRSAKSPEEHRPKNFCLHFSALIISFPRHITWDTEGQTRRT